MVKGGYSLSSRRTKNSQLKRQKSVAIHLSLTLMRVKLVTITFDNSRFGKTWETELDKNICVNKIEDWGIGKEYFQYWLLEINIFYQNLRDSINLFLSLLLKIYLWNSPEHFKEIPINTLSRVNLDSYVFLFTQIMISTCHEYSNEITWYCLLKKILTRN